MGNENPPLVFIGMFVRNEEEYVAQAIESLLAQTFADFTLFISDNASEDRTGEICRAYAEKDSRVVYYRQPENIGARRNARWLLERADCKYFMWAAADDLWCPDFLRLHVQALEADPAGTLAFCPCAAIDQDGNMLSVRRADYSSPFALFRLVKFAYHHDDCCIYGLFRREQMVAVREPIWWGVNKTQALDTAYPILCQILAAGNFHFVGERPLFFKRMHAVVANRWQSEVSGAAKRSISLSYYLAFLLRNLNVFVDSVIWTYRGSRSVLLAAAAAPVFFARYAYFVVSQTFIVLFKLAAAAFRKNASPKPSDG